MRIVEVQLPNPLKQHRADLARVAQEVYNEWDEHPDVYGGGGICHLIADKIVDYFSDKGYDATTISSDHEVHVWTAVHVPNRGIYSVDISPYTYERGGGYNWTKIPDVVFDPEDVSIDFIATEDEKGNYFEMMESLTEAAGSRLPEGVAEAFAQVADMQRGAPEMAMLRVQHAYKGGVLSPVVEHVGDLLHRMTEHAKYSEYLESIIREKVERGLRYLQHPYGFEREMQENIRHNGIDADKLKLLLKAYAQEHRKLPVYNAAHYAAREAAVAIGEQDWYSATKYLEYLKGMLDNGKYQEIVSSYKLDDNGNLVTYSP